MTDIAIETPETSPLTRFTEALARGDVAVSGAVPPARSFPPRLTLGAASAALGSARSGTVYSATRISTRAGTHVLALVDLDGGGRLLARIRDDGEAASLIGRAVALVATPREGEPRLTFETRDRGESA